MSEEKKKRGLFGGGKKKSGCCDFEIVEETECDCGPGCCAPDADAEQKQAVDAQE